MCPDMGAANVYSVGGLASDAAVDCQVPSQRREVAEVVTGFAWEQVLEFTLDEEASPPPDSALA